MGTMSSPWPTEAQIPLPGSAFHGRTQHNAVAPDDSYTGVVRCRLEDAEVMVAVGALQVPSMVILLVNSDRWRRT